ncbi:MAG: hypothetical protein ACW97X_11145 [Candidatus Hodarchaeales archaeon]|jgi:hypothetical protein
MPSPKRKKNKIKNFPRPPSPDSQSKSPLSDLPPPPIFSHQIKERPPFPEPLERSPSFKYESMAIEDDITGDLLEELKEIGFGAFLENVPEVRRPEPSIDEVTSVRYLSAKDVYLDAGKKHLELGFYENAAMNFSCAILCVFLGKDAFEGAHEMSNMASKLSNSITNSYSFQGVKLLLKSNLLKDPSLLEYAKKWLLRNSENIFQEDKDVILRAIHQSERNLKKVFH